MGTKRTKALCGTIALDSVGSSLEKKMHFCIVSLTIKEGFV